MHVRLLRKRAEHGPVVWLCTKHTENLEAVEVHVAICGSACSYLPQHQMTPGSEQFLLIGSGL